MIESAVVTGEQVKKAVKKLKKSQKKKLKKAKNKKNSSKAQISRRIHFLHLFDTEMTEK